MNRTIQQQALSALAQQVLANREFRVALIINDGSKYEDVREMREARIGNDPWDVAQVGETITARVEVHCRRADNTDFISLAATAIYSADGSLRLTGSGWSEGNYFSKKSINYSKSEYEGAVKRTRNGGNISREVMESLTEDWPEADRNEILGQQ